MALTKDGSMLCSSCVPCCNATFTNMQQLECRNEIASARARYSHWRSVALSFTVDGNLLPAPPASSESCDTEAEAWDAVALRMRGIAGSASCKKQRIGPTGGYCLSSHKARKDGNDCLSEQLAISLHTQAFTNNLTLSNVSVLDLGCGVGQYGSWFRKHAPAVKWTGVDGAENVEQATNGTVTFVDLTEGLPRSIRRSSYDWVMSLEVAEHIPRAGEPAYIHAMASMAQRGVVLSWAHPGQLGAKGAKHVNTQAAPYVSCAMQLVGFDRDPYMQRRLKLGTRESTMPCPWLGPNMMVFVRQRRPRTQQEKRLRLLALLRQPMSPEFARLYLELTSEVCRYSPCHLSPASRCGTVGRMFDRTTLNYSKS